MPYSTRRSTKYPTDSDSERDSEIREEGSVVTTGRVRHVVVVKGPSYLGWQFELLLRIGGIMTLFVFRPRAFQVVSFFVLLSVERCNIHLLMINLEFTGSPSPPVLLLGCQATNMSKGGGADDI